MSNSLNENQQLTKAEEMRMLDYFLSIDSSGPGGEKVNPDFLELGHLAKSLMDSGIIDYTFFTRNW